MDSLCSGGGFKTNLEEIQSYLYNNLGLYLSVFLSVSLFVRPRPNAISFLIFALIWNVRTSIKSLYYGKGFKTIFIQSRLEMKKHSLQTFF